MGPSPTTHASLLGGLREAANEEAWGRFVELYAPLLYGYFRHRKLQDADAADLTQEVLQVVARRIAVFEHRGARGAFRSWLFAICRYKLRQYTSRKGRTASRPGEEAGYSLIHELPAKEDDRLQWERQEQRRLFAWAAAKLKATVDAPTWEAFWRTAVLGQPAGQVAAALEKSVGAVYVAKSRVIARLKELIEPLEDD